MSYTLLRVLIIAVFIGTLGSCGRPSASPPADLRTRPATTAPAGVTTGEAPPPPAPVSAPPQEDNATKTPAPIMPLAGAAADHEAATMAIFQFSEACGDRNLDKVAALVSDDFSAPGLARNKDDLKAVLESIQSTYGKVAFDCYSSTVELSGTEATVSPVEVIISSFHVDPFKFLLKKQNDKWLISGISILHEEGAKKPEDIRSEAESGGAQF